jgi:glycosyltransferase involved in cell wall biosynthesis
MKKTKLFFIDYASFDNSGSYIDKIKSNINKDIDYHFFLHSAYKFNSLNSTRIFNKISDKINFKKLNNISKFFEMYLSFTYIYLRLLFNFHLEKKVIVSLYQPFTAYSFFFKLVKILNAELYIIVHDLIPLESNYPKFILSSQNSLLQKADKFIVHNEHSRDGLIKFNKKIYLIRFPLMEIEKNISLTTKKTSIINFLFIGHLRKEKGIELLLDVWRKFSVKHDSVYLTIAGSIANGLNFNFDNLQKCEIIDGYIDDAKYSQLIQNCDYGILPYTGGTNSGVFSTIISFNKPVLSSDISLFKDSEFSIDELMFGSGNEKDFLRVLESLMDSSKEKINFFNNIIKNRIESHKVKFYDELNSSLHSIVNEIN